MKLSKLDKLIIANALSLCPIASLGDRIPIGDAKLAIRLVELAAMFDKDTAEDMRMFVHQFK